MNIDPEFYYKRNKGARQRVSAWVSNFAQYDQFSDGCGLIMDFYDTDNILKRDYWTLHEIVTRLNNCISISLFYGNAYQIVDSLRYATDCIMTVEASRIQSATIDISATLSAFGWTGKNNRGWRPAWE